MNHSALPTFFLQALRVIPAFFLLLGLPATAGATEPNIIDYRYLDETPQVTKKGTLVYPETKRGFTFEGYVLLWVTLAEDGSVYQVEILGTNHPEYTDSALNAVLNSSFTSPLFKEERVGTQFPLSVRFSTEEMLVGFPEVVDYQILTGDSQLLPSGDPLYPAPGFIEFRTVPKDFVISEGVRETSSDFQIDPHQSADSYFDFQDEILGGPFPYTEVPVVTKFFLPVFPLNKMISGKGREHVTVSWVVDSSGFPYDPVADPNTDPLYARSAEASVRYWRFMPGKLGGKPTNAGLAYPFLFDRFKIDSDTKRLANQLLEGKLDFHSPSQLDEPLHITVLQQVKYPRVKDKAYGYAELKIHINEAGHVFYPEIVETDNEYLAWSALTAVAQWRFRPPTVKGQPVKVVFRQRFEN